MPCRRYIIWLFLLLAPLSLWGQSTRVRGTVRDASTGEPLPFVGIYFDGTTIGISTDMDGRYSLETRSRDAKVLTAQLLGYESASARVTPGAFSEIDFSLKPDPRQLEAAVVRPDDRYIKSILRLIDEAREKHDPDNAPDWNGSVYTKIEFDVTNMEDLLSLGVLDRNLGFVRNYSDTSAITGQAFIPAILSENRSDLYHSAQPSFNREFTRASRISGIPDENNAIKQFSGTYLLKTNFYKSSIGVFNLVIPNPIASSSRLFYNYFLVDSLQVEGRKTYVLRFHPKKLVTSPTLDGEMHIDAEDFGIRSVHASLSGASNVNWIRHFNVDVESRRLPDGRWFYDTENLFLDFALTSNDNSRLISLLGRRSMHYEMPVFGPLENKGALLNENAVVMRDVVRGDDAYWDTVRPYPLSAREKGIYKMVDEIQQSSFYKWTYGFLDTFITGYLEVPSLHFEFGRWARTFVWNDFEGFRVQVGGRTLYTMSEKLRLGGYLAYGFKDHRLKGMAELEWQIARERTRKLTLTYKDDYDRLGSGKGVFSVPNIFSSIVSPSLAARQTYVRSLDVFYEHEFHPSVNAELEWLSQRMWSNDVVPIYAVDGTRTVMESIAVHQLRAGVRISFDEKVHRNYFRKTYLFTKYPILEFSLYKGFKGISQNDFDFLKAESVITWRVPSTAVGFGYLYLRGGIIWGNVPHTLLNLHAGNATFFFDKHAFSCMQAYEFASDRWISGFYEHNFNGFFLGKIPLLKELDWREVATVRFAWGDMSETNQKNVLQETGLLNTPYVETGIGIGNILRVFRVDFFWRLTHRLPEAGRNFSVNLGVDVSF